MEFSRDQRLPPNDVEMDGHWYEDLGTFPARGNLWVQLFDRDAAAGEFIIADAVRFEPVAGADQARPGSRTNRGENGFYAFLLLQAADPNASWSTVHVGVEDQIDPQTEQYRLAGRSVKLDWDGDETVIKIYTDPAMTPQSQIHPGYTWEIGQVTDIYVKGVEEGTTELVLSLAPIENDPFAGQRPISDLIAVAVSA
jgi:hypothetical protein